MAASQVNKTAHPFDKTRFEALLNRSSSTRRIRGLRRCRWAVRLWKKGAKAAPVKLDDAVVLHYESILAQLDNYTGPELGEICRKHDIRNPDTDNEVGEPQQFNLMFASSIGPTVSIPATSAPKPRRATSSTSPTPRVQQWPHSLCLCTNRARFRNEISPRAGLLRVREFTMAEIEHYVDPADKSHPRFNEVRGQVLTLLDRKTQELGSSQTKSLTVGEAVDTGIIANETLGYFVARIYQFLVKIGVNPKRLRFRQHMGNEMAHYATDCWDAEIENATGWTEMEQEGSGQTFKADAALLQKTVESLPELELERMKSELLQGSTVVHTPDGRQFQLTPEIITIERKVFKQSIREFIPNVIEPSFGLGRILYTLLEHSFWAREQDIERGVLSLPPVVAPTKVLIVPLSARDEFAPIVAEVSSKLRKAGVFSRVDDSNTSIGKRYARNDELGTPFGITVDFASVQNRTMTLRERDTTDQRIGSIDEVIAVVTDLVNGTIDWNGACERLPAYDGVQALRSRQE
ncbi:putative anticodon binding domain containing protein [Lyophyllum shimeji]|uniref:Anticodon binding domain containing protein n=1 Tax=Lyophyllum shimeji TaxID=47721 RepID=A0A9P3Q0T0_LYOSH|nr:putative anticodon binding domain containing protein [Lyophyllum shimeji]